MKILPGPFVSLYMWDSFQGSLADALKNFSYTCWGRPDADSELLIVGLRAPGNETKRHSPRRCRPL